MTFLFIFLIILMYVVAALLATKRVLTSTDLERRQKALLVGAAWVLPFVGPGLVWSAARSGLLGDFPRFNHDPYVLSALADAGNSTPSDAGTADGGGGTELLRFGKSGEALCQPPNKQLQRTVTRRRVRGARAPFHYARAPRFIRQRAAAELRR